MEVLLRERDRMLISIITKNDIKMKTMSPFLLDVVIVVAVVVTVNLRLASCQGNGLLLPKT